MRCNGCESSMIVENDIEDPKIFTPDNHVKIKPGIMQSGK
jgi:hypothetical protein